MGYSDNTNLAFLLPTLCDVASIYGYCFPEFGASTWHDSVRDHYDLLKGNKLIFSGYEKYEVKSLKKIKGNELVSFNLTKDVRYHVLSKEKEFNVEGRVLAGCLDVLTMLCGTQFDKVKEFVGKVVAIIHRFDDVEEKWVVAPENSSYTKDEIMKQVAFQEQYFRTEIRM